MSILYSVKLWFLKKQTLKIYKWIEKEMKGYT